MVKEEYVSYFHKGYELEGFVATNEKGKRPLVLIFHNFYGRGDPSIQMARRLAKLGFVGFAVDMYGKGIIGQSKEESSKLMSPFMEDRAFLIERAQAAFLAATSLDYVDTKKVAAIGYCFGGLCAVDLARSGADLKGVISFHGHLLRLPPQIPKAPIKSKILVCHGYNDRHVPMEEVADFEREMDEANVDWQVHIYGHTVHAFTLPSANDADFGTVYNKDSDQRSFRSMKDFLEDVF